MCRSELLLPLTRGFRRVEKSGKTSLKKLFLVAGLFLAFFYARDFFLDCCTFRVVVENNTKQPLFNVLIDFGKGYDNCGVHSIDPHQSATFWPGNVGESGPIMSFNDPKGLQHRVHIDEYLYSREGSININVDSLSTVYWTYATIVADRPLKEQKALVEP